MDKNIQAETIAMRIRGGKPIQLQTFPEDFNFEGTITNIEQMIGNAVPVNLGYYVADAIFRYSGEQRVEPKGKSMVKSTPLFE